MSKKLHFFVLTVLFFSAFFTFKTRDALAQNLDSFNPPEAVQGMEATIAGNFYCFNSQIAFYEGLSKKAETSISPIIKYGKDPETGQDIQINCLKGGIPNPLTSYGFKFNVPSNLAPGIYQARLEHSEGVSNSLPLAIRSFVDNISPNQGTHDAEPTITGSGFRSDKRANNIVALILGASLKPINIISVSSNQLKVGLRVDPILPIATYQVQVSTLGTTTASWGAVPEYIWLESQYRTGFNREFKLVPHLTELTPSSGASGNTIIIKGIYFHTDEAKIKVRFYQGNTQRGSDYSPVSGTLSASGDSFTAKIPDLTAGTYNVKVAVQDANNSANLIESDNSKQFTIQAGAVDVQTIKYDFNPAQLAKVTLWGKLNNLGGAAEAKVWFEWRTELCPDYSSGCSNSSGEKSKPIGDFSDDISIQLDIVYFFRAVAKTDAGTFPAPEELSFKITPSAPPSQEINPPDLVKPANGTEFLNNVSIRLEWSQVVDSSKNPVYGLRIEFPDGQVKYLNNNISANYFELPATLFANQTESGVFYYWTVRLIRSDDNKWSQYNQNEKNFFVKLPSVITPPPGGGFFACKKGQLCPANALCNPLCAENFEDLLNIIINFIFWIAMALAPLMIIIAGFYFVTAGGDPKRFTTGRDILVWVAVGIAIVLLAKGLLAVLKGIIGG